MSWLNKFMGDPNAKALKALAPILTTINSLETQQLALDDQDFSLVTTKLKARIQAGEALEVILPEAYALVREASHRVLGQRHYDVQLLGGLVLNGHGIAEMRTGEGKTLTATAPVYLNALTGKGVHVVTVNDYLAKRDAVWMGKLFHFLGLTVGCIQHEGGYLYDSGYEAVEPVNADATVASFKVSQKHLRPVTRAEAYQTDITYGTNNEFGFDYLRDNMAQSTDQVVQRGLYFAMVDEVDSILIDEARTPLIISAPAEESAALYAKFAKLSARLAPPDDYNIDEKLKAVTLTDAGIEKLEGWLGVANLYSEGLQLVHHAEQAVRAQALFKKDRDYVVREDEVVIVDEFTGRMMEGRRYSEGLHQAIEAKEGVTVQRESKTLATITFQNYFRLYEKLAGMTGTAVTEAEEFSKIYNLEVVSIPTNKQNSRKDLPDKVFQSENGKWLALVEEVKRRHQSGQPILIGTVSIEKNELLGSLLTAAGLQFKLLNAKNHEQEGEIIAQAGKPGAVTLATNMAGRGVDIILGGNPGTETEATAVKTSGGLHVIGTERHESRRIDNQLRGRSGRQGDFGSTQFFVSLDDDLMRIFGGQRVKSMMATLGVPESEPIESKMVTRSLEKAQQKVEGHHFDTRKHVLEYDDVLNKHRKAVYHERKDWVSGTNETILIALKKIYEEEISRLILWHSSERVAWASTDSSTFPNEEEKTKTDWDPNEILESLKAIVPCNQDREETLTKLVQQLSPDKEHLAEDRTILIDQLNLYLSDDLTALQEKLGEESELTRWTRYVLLKSLDDWWTRHLDNMSYLRRSIGLQGYAQRDPLVEYKKEAFRMYGEMRQEVGREVAINILKFLNQVVEAQKLSQAVTLAQRKLKSLTN